MNRLIAYALAAVVALGAFALAAPKAEAGVRVGVGIGFGVGPRYWHDPGFYPRYFEPRYRRYYRPRYYRPRYYRPRYYRRPVVVRRGLSNAHVAYCARRYRSYRVSDNSFQPYRGPRRQCRSRYR